MVISSFPILLLATNLELLTQKANDGDALSAYQIGTIYEEQNDKEHSSEWYKKAASLALGANRHSALENSILADQIKTAEHTQEIYSDALASYKDKETENSARQMLTESFDILPYQKNYLLPLTYDGTTHENRKHQETKFQLSFQKKLLDNFFGLDETISAAYTQTSWWQTATKYPSFRETNYQPEIFMIIPNSDQDAMLKAYKFGLLHESNGQDNEKSRSWNRLYAKAFFQYEGLIIAPRVWYRILEGIDSDNNPNIDDYLGYGDLQLIYPWKKQTFGLLVKNNFHFDNTNKGALQFDWTFPLWEQNLFGYLQLYSGYSESLIDYDKRTDRIGIGFAFSR